MKMYKLKKELKTNSLMSAFVYKDYIYRYHWIMFNGGKCSDTMKFKRNGTVDVIENGACRSYRFQHSLLNTFCLSSDAEKIKFSIVYMNEHLLVFQMEDRGGCLILIAPDDFVKFNLVTLEAIEHFMSSKHPKVEAKSTFMVPGDIVLDEAVVEDPDEDYTAYGDFTKEEIIYDYLQRQEEEQAEEDYYLEQLKKDD